MQERIYKGFTLRVYDSHAEYERENDAKFAWCDAEGNELDVNTEDLDLSHAQSKEHFSEDTTYANDNFLWHAEISDELPKGIACILAGNPEKVSFEEILTTVGHEYGHIIDADDFQNSTAGYDTPEGYEQEETKALTFERFVRDSYQMALLFRTMFMDMGIKVEGIA